MINDDLNLMNEQGASNYLKKKSPNRFGKRTIKKCYIWNINWIKKWTGELYSKLDIAEKRIREL